VSDLTITEIGQDRLDDLRPLWLSLLRYHVDIGSRPLVVDEAASWERRRRHYATWLEQEAALVLVAERTGRPVGYVVVRLEEGLDDVYPWGERHAEIYSLSVAAGARGQGIGTRLLDAVDAQLTALGIVDVTVAAMVENDAALRFYQRRGFVPRELYLCRFGTFSVGGHAGLAERSRLVPAGQPGGARKER
jgi:ribosomal protein S18 acetylase RimI-like enzyme